MTFEWVDSKAESNVTKHGVTFQEAASAFDDQFFLVFEDPDHSIGEARFLLLGRSNTEREDRIRVISAREATKLERNTLKKTELDDTLRQEYDFSELKVVARGPGRKKGRTVEIEPDVAEVFPTAEAVNEALRFQIRIGKATPR